MTVVASKYARKENEFYQTPPWVTRALLRHVPIGTRTLVWEPAAGNHLMADAIRTTTGARVFTSDIKQYDRPHDKIHNFLEDDDFLDCDAIITNPPYGKQNRMAAEFARVALEGCAGYVCLLLTMKFDSGKGRVDLFRDNPRFDSKIVLLDRIKWFEGEGKHSGTEDHCWLVWRPINAPARTPAIFYEGKDE